MAKVFYTTGTLNGGHTGLTGTPVWEEDFSLDQTGNWGNYTTKVSGSTTLNQDRTFNDVNEIATIAGASTYIAQNAAGNLTLAPKPSSWSSAYTLIYDAWNRLAQVKSGATVVVTYAYDGQNWRIKEIAGDTTQDNYFNVNWQLVEVQVDAEVTKWFFWGLLARDNLALRVEGSVTAAVFADANGNVTAITTGAGSVEERYSYNAFGAPNFMAADWDAETESSYDWDVLFASYRYDSLSGLYQVRNRYLHPTLGRWLSREPVGYQGGVNLYAYVGNNPVNRVDPLGLDPSTQCCAPGTCNKWKVVIDGDGGVDFGIGFTAVFANLYGDESCTFPDRFPPAKYYSPYTFYGAGIGIGVDFPVSLSKDDSTINIETQKCVTFGDFSGFGDVTSIAVAFGYGWSGMRLQSQQFTKYIGGLGWGITVPGAGISLGNWSVLFPD